MWHKKGVIAPRPKRTPRPLNETKLRELALAYVGRFATTRGKLGDYLNRKIRERGWAGDAEPHVAALADHFARQGYIDDSGYALAKAQGLVARGYGKRRLIEKLRIAGVDETDGLAARDLAEREAVAAALRFAERRRLGPFAAQGHRDRKDQQKAIAAMIRAGHGYALARAIVLLNPGEEVDPGALEEKVRRDAA